MNTTKRVIVIWELLTLILFWVCAFYLNASTGSVWITVLTSITLSFGSIGSGFILYEIWKEWKSIESN